MKNKLLFQNINCTFVKPKMKKDLAQPHIVVSISGTTGFCDSLKALELPFQKNYLDGFKNSERLSKASKKLLESILELQNDEWSVEEFGEQFQKLIKRIIKLEKK